MAVVRCYKKYALGTSCGLVLLFFATTAGQDLETTTSYWWHSNGDVRLVEGPSPNIGRVEIYLYGHWRTVCPTLWNNEDATVVCRQLGYEGFAQSRLYGLASASYGYILIDNVVCNGSESTLLQCSSDHLYESDCPGSYYAGVRCDHSATTTYYDGDVTLVGGSTSNEGRVEIYYNGQWNTVCSDLWDSKDASVVCRQLGYDGSVEAFGDAHFGSGDGDILLDNIACSGHEFSLLECFSNNLYEHDCTHRNDAGVRCGDTKVNIDAVASIVIGCVFALVCVGVCLLVTFRHSKQRRTSEKPRIAVISGRTYLTGPSASQFKYNNFPPPPTYDEVMNNSLHGCQHAHSLS